MVKCPWCAEEILAEAKKCKHCGEFLTDEVPEVCPPCKRGAHYKCERTTDLKNRRRCFCAVCLTGSERQPVASPEASSVASSSVAGTTTMETADPWDGNEYIAASIEMHEDMLELKRQGYNHDEAVARAMSGPMMWVQNTAGPIYGDEDYMIEGMGAYLESMFDAVVNAGFTRSEAEWFVDPFIKFNHIHNKEKLTWLKETP